MTHWTEKAVDADLRSELEKIDEKNIEVSEWEASFIDSVCFKFPNRRLSVAQRVSATTIIKKYENHK